MGSEVAAVAPQTLEVPMVEAEAVRQMRDLASKGWGAKRIARELGLARNTVRRYLRGGAGRRGAAASDAAAARRGAAEPKPSRCSRARRRATRSSSRRCSPRAASRRASGRCSGPWRSAGASCARGGRSRRCASRRRQAGRCRSTSASDESGSPAQQVTVHFMAAVLSYSRRLFVKAFLHERQGEWLDGIASAFRHFGGVPLEVLGDNARCLVLGRNREAQTVTFHPAYVAFCRDWDVQPRACQPYRARTKGKTESGVKYVKRNAIAGRRFDSFAHLQAHLAEWKLAADQRVHGTTHEAPMVRFEREERGCAPAAAGAAAARPTAAVCSGASRTTPSSTSTRCATACRIGSSATTSRRSSRRRGAHLPRSRSRRRPPPLVRAARARGRPGPLRRPLAQARRENVVPLAQPLAALGRTLDDYAAVIGGAA